MLEMSDMRTTYLKNGSARYAIELTHRGLKKHQIIKGEYPRVVQQKARLKAAEWAERWTKVEEADAHKRAREKDRRRKEDLRAEAAERAEEAQAVLASVEGILLATLDVDDTIDWASLEDHSAYPELRPKRPAPLEAPTPCQQPPKPYLNSFQPKLALFDKLIRSRGENKRAEAKARFEVALREWEESCRHVEAQHEQAERDFKAKRVATEAAHKQAVREWEAARSGWEAERDQGNEVIRQQRDRYLARDPAAVEEYCDLVLSRSDYPDLISLEHEVQYIEETRTLVVETMLPSVEDMPTLRDVKYVQSRDEFDEKHLSENQIRKMYDGVLYQICLRTIHELLEADAVDAIDAVAVNGSVTSVDRATGRSFTACILSMQVSKDEFLKINLAAVDPKACFKNFRGVGSSKLHSLTPVAPIMQFRRDDGRFISGREIANTLDEGVNLAAMDWEEFEHLIRELFEQEFKAAGGEVSVTQASRDGGVDAIAFDPDPIRGGKIVIQAKRYTHTVGVAAVRDLYGTVMNEGATKGILVTTSDYGPDAYAFAKDKPITLLSGANLLHLLQKHGHRAKIDIKEARALLSH